MSRFKHTVPAGSANGQYIGILISSALCLVNLVLIQLGGEVLLAKNELKAIVSCLAVFEAKNEELCLAFERDFQWKKNCIPFGLALILVCHAHNVSI